MPKSSFIILTAVSREWSKADTKTGITLAHIVAASDMLPEGFDQWELADKDGLTVAHVAAYNGNLPANFTQWHLVDNKGVTVAQTALDSSYTPPDLRQSAKAWKKSGKR